MAVPELSGELKQLTDLVLGRWDASEKVHKTYRSRWEHYYGLYRGYQEMKDSMAGADRRDRDMGLREAQKVWGTELFIPYSFATVETILPRALSNRPRMLILPQGKASAENVENMRQLIDRQQEQIAYEIKLQDTAKSGLIYGLGIQKTPWRKEYRETMELQPATVPGDTPESQWTPQKVRKCTFDDPDAVDVDIFDFRWDPFGFDIPSCRYVIHRIWRDTRYVMAKLMPDPETGVSEWSNPAMLAPEDLEGMGPKSKWDESVQQRQKMAGMAASDVDLEGVHEIWEYHDQEGRLIILLDGLIPVHVAENPYWHGELCFQAFRPTTSGMKELPGIGEVEPIEQLQIEINVLRSQRRDNAALKLMQVFAFNDGFVDQNDLQMFPGAGWPVNGDPREVLMQVQVGDIPNSGYAEEAALKGDIELASGVSDPVAGRGDASQTATGVQLVQAAANVRIQNKTRRIEVELCAPAARQWVSMNQQMILSRPLPVPAEPTPMEPGKKWTTIQLGPGELAGDFIILPEGGAIAPENLPQKRADALAFWNFFRDHPAVDQRKLIGRVLELMDERNSESWLNPAMYVPPVALDILVQDFDVPEEIVAEAVEMGLQFEEAQRNGTTPEGAPGEAPGQSEEPPMREIVRDGNGRVSGVKG